MAIFRTRRPHEPPIEPLDREALLARVGTTAPRETPTATPGERDAPRDDAPQPTALRAWRRALEQPL